MNPRMVPPGYYSLFPWLSEQDQATQANFLANFQDLCSRGMDRALGMQETTLDCAVELHSTAIDLYKTSPWYSPVVGEMFEAGARFLVFCLEMQMKCLDVFLVKPVAATAPLAAKSAGSPNRAEQALQELAMDIGSGLNKKSGARSAARTANC